MTAGALQTLLRSARDHGRAALLPFLTAGLPDPASSVEMFVAMADAGADAFEVGVPYSDPLMDGPVIQEGASRALAAGTDLHEALHLVQAVVERTAKPVIVMTYANPVFRVGVESFADRIRDAGASGLIVADLPLEEAVVVKQAVEAVGLGMALFAAPTTDDARLERIAAADPAFIYGVARLGVTGEREDSSATPRRLAERIRAVAACPLVMGVGISTPDQVRQVADVADGVIVGSALVRIVLDASSPAEAAALLGSRVGELSAALDR